MFWRASYQKSLPQGLTVNLKCQMNLFDFLLFNFQHFNKVAQIPTEKAESQLNHVGMLKEYKAVSAYTELMNDNCNHPTTAKTNMMRIAFSTLSWWLAACLQFVEREFQLECVVSFMSLILLEFIGKNLKDHSSSVHIVQRWFRDNADEDSRPS